MADIFTEALHKANANAEIISGQIGFDETADILEKGGKRASVGEIRDWRGGRFQKTADGWKPVPQRHSRESLKETEIEGLRNGAITENELNGLPVGTEIHFDSNGSYYRKDSEGWIYGNSVLGRERRANVKNILETIKIRMESDSWMDGKYGLKQVLVPGEEKKDSKNGFLDKDGRVTWDKSSAFTDENTWEGKLWHNVQRFQKLHDPSILSEIANTITERFKPVLKTKKVSIASPILPVYGRVEFGWGNLLNFKNASIVDLQKLFDSFYKEYKEKNPEKKDSDLAVLVPEKKGEEYEIPKKNGGLEDFAKQVGFEVKMTSSGAIQMIKDGLFRGVVGKEKDGKYFFQSPFVSEDEISIDRVKDLIDDAATGFGAMQPGDTLQIWGNKFDVTGRTFTGEIKLKDAATGIEIVLNKDSYDKLRIKSNKKVGTGEVAEWYKKKFPTDNFGDSILNMSFEDVYKHLKDGDFEDTYYADDSVVRERIFKQLAKIKGVSYDTIYNMWLGA